MRTTPSGKQLESVINQVSDGWQVKGAECGEPATKQVAERLMENGEHRDPP